MTRPNYAEHPVIARARLVTPGFADLDNLAGDLKKDAPALPPEAMAFIFQTAASKHWVLQHGDIEAAFLSGAYFEREVFVVAPRGGLPATAKTPFIPEGTVLQLKKSSLDLPMRLLSSTRSTAKGYSTQGSPRARLPRRSTSTSSPTATP